MEKLTKDRRHALKLGGIMLCAFACGKPDAVLPVGDKPFEILLTEGQAKALQQVGGFVFAGQFFVMRLSAAEFRVLSRWCTHAAGALRFNAGANLLECPVHGSVFSTEGTVLQGPANAPLKRYRYELRQDKLLVFPD
ncbi:QcrA and Rieske domain-containing protein [Rhodoflexus caldus]|uniref:QcrA and Rieske domain-containing protein n=1 Tax=Rhodoflexus caldus TaxID=2891236 RepID=UPI00202AB1B3|nr:Rieske 2Fe-2S domain-containing protein [Rhodoflexus caldus]